MSEQCEKIIGNNNIEILFDDDVDGSECLICFEYNEQFKLIQKKCKCKCLLCNDCIMELVDSFIKCPYCGDVINLENNYIEITGDTEKKTKTKTPIPIINVLINPNYNGEDYEDLQNILKEKTHNTNVTIQQFANYLQTKNRNLDDYTFLDVDSFTSHYLLNNSSVVEKINDEPKISFLSRIFNLWK
jgi:hypothetical protein